MKKDEIKKRLNSGYRLRRRSWPEGDFIFVDRTDTVRRQDWTGYHDGIDGDDWHILYIPKEKR